MSVIWQIDGKLSFTWITIKSTSLYVLGLIHTKQPVARTLKCDFKEKRKVAITAQQNYEPGIEQGAFIPTIIWNPASNSGKLPSVLPFYRSSTARKLYRQRWSPGLSRFYHNTSSIKPGVKELKNSQTQMILSSLLLVEGHDLTGKGTFRKCGLAIKMTLTSGLWSVDCSPPCENNRSLSGEVTVSSTQGITASWATEKTDHKRLQSKISKEERKAMQYN